MAATVEIRVFTGTDAATESTGDTTTLNALNTDENDSTGIVYHGSRIVRTPSSTVYSYERWIKLRFSGSFNTISNIKAYHASGTLRDSVMDLLAGTTDTGVTPVNTVSSVATTTLSSWDSLAEGIDITPAGGISSSPAYSDFFVVQLKVPQTSTFPGDLGLQGLIFDYNQT